MWRTLVVSVGVVALSAPAQVRAEATQPRVRQVSVAVNAPTSWYGATAIAGSLATAVARHHTLRVNVASYETRLDVIGEMLALARGGTDSALAHHGRTTDVGAAYTYYPRRAWDGLALEAGVVHRFRDVVTEPELTDYRAVASQVTAVRAQVGWSWLFADRVFLAVALGVSAGYERGTQTVGSDYHDPQPGSMPVTTRIERADIETEGMVRVGVAFDLTSASAWRR